MQPKIKFGIDFYSTVLFNADLKNLDQNSHDRMALFIDFLLVWFWNFTSEETNEVWSKLPKHFAQNGHQIRKDENQLIDYLIKNKELSKTFEKNLLMIYFFDYQKSLSLLNYARMFGSRLGLSDQEYEQLYANARIKTKMIMEYLKGVQLKN